MFGQSDSSKAFGFILPAVTATAVLGSAMMVRRIWCLDSKLASDEQITLTSRLGDRMKRASAKARRSTKLAEIDQSLAGLQAMIDQLQTGCEFQA